MQQVKATVGEDNSPFPGGLAKSPHGFIYRKNCRIQEVT
jgi:hypothetical protein